jgi:glucose-6-phosphate 1-dehydrogenase
MSSIVMENPLREGIRLERTAGPCAVVIFGASGDLAKRKLLPALYRLVQQRLLPAEFAIVGLARTEMTSEEFRARLREAVEEFSAEKSVDEEVWNSFAQGLYYITGDINTADDYRKLKELLEQVDRERGTAGNRLFYLSIAKPFASWAKRA